MARNKSPHCFYSGIWLLCFWKNWCMPTVSGDEACGSISEVSCRGGSRISIGGGANSRRQHIICSNFSEKLYEIENILVYRQAHWGCPPPRIRHWVVCWRIHRHLGISWLHLVSGEGNVFTDICLSIGERVWCRGRGGVCLGGVYIARCLGRPPCHKMATAAVGRHPTGMHSCLENNYAI